jgi:hypothetical protein
MVAAQPVQAQAAPKKTKALREEMWWLTIAKSKTMRFFAVSCEFIIFLGCLWLTLVTVLPNAEGWFNGTIDSFFIVAMSFAVDAALPEAWLHVVDQYTETPRKRSQLAWSIPIAGGMLILVVANIIYAKVTGQSSTAPSGSAAIWVDILLISRMFIGISYVTIRECQSFLDRKHAKQQPAPLAPIEVQALVHQEMSSLQTTFQQMLAGMTDEQARLTQTLQQLQSQAVVSPPVSAVPEIDYQRIVNAVSSQLVGQVETRFTSALQRLDAQMKQPLLVSAASETGQMKQSNGTDGTALAGPRLVSLPQRPATRTVKQPASEPTTGQQEAVENQNHKATVYALLEQDNRLQVAEIVAQTNISRTTVWRHWNRYHQEHGTHGLARMMAGETSDGEGGETESER